MTIKRRSYESGHRPKYLVVIDESPECDRAVYYASRRAVRVNASVLMLRVIDTEDRNQQWLGVADIMRAEAHEAANALLDKFTSRANGVAGITPERVVREGPPSQVILQVIEEDTDISVFVLAAGSGKEGPGPLVSQLIQTAADFPIPVVIVPGNLSDDELDSMT